jgi:hypothetical protein
MGLFQHMLSLYTLARTGEAHRVLILPPLFL